ncbi:MAG TPA: Ig-like domain-containing protein [Tepidisphaeraceae bacterium]|jgi:hypothetical protein|nr:Ig-like domain-containing protein [Tepidisphaeraceae bacterium]
MPARPRFASIEALESRQLLSAAAAAVFEQSNIAPVLRESAVQKSPTSAAVNQAITKSVGVAPSSTNLQLAMGQPNPAVSGSEVSFVAIINPAVGGGPTPTGTVSFFDNSTMTPTMIGSIPIDPSSGTAVAPFTTTTPLSLGTHPITAMYSGDGNYMATASSNTINVIIGAATTTTISASSTLITPGAPGVQFSAGVTSSTPGTQTGSVTFTADGNNVLATVTIMNGTAVTPSITNLAAGIHSVTATYSGDSNYIMSVSAPVNVTVSTPTTTTLAATTNGSPTPAMVPPGTMVTLTATVTPNPAGGLAINGDTVTFYNNGLQIGTGTTTNGVATFTTPNLPNGSDSLTASFPGDGTYRASDTTSSPITINVAQLPTTTSLTEASPSVAVGASAVFTAIVSPPPGDSTPTGNVTFYEGNTNLGTTPMVNGSAIFSITTLPIGTHIIYAVYNGDTAYTTSTSNNVSEVVGIATSTALTANPPGPVTPGTQVTFTATVTQLPTTNPAPTGQVTFTDGGINLATMPLVNGVASYSTMGLPNGTNNITATYGGDAANVASTSSVVPVLVGLATSVVVSTPNQSAGLGAPVVLNASVTPAVAGSGFVPTGMVTFYDGATPLASAMLVNGVATITVTSLTTGSHTITAAYGGDMNFTANHPNQGVTVSIGSAMAVNANVGLTASAPAAGLGDPITFIATVSATGMGAVVPTGAATFQNGGVTIGTAMLDMNGMAMFSTAALPSGPNVITVLYSGDSNYNPGMGGPLTETVGNVPGTTTTTTLAASAPSAAVGNSLTFTATVAPTVPGGPVPTGTVTFTNGTTVIGTTMVQPNGAATLSTTTLPPGVDMITATYSGDISNVSSVSNTVTEMIGATPGNSVNLTLSSTAVAIPVGGTVTITATVQPVVAGPAPTGTVTFLLNGTALGTATVQANVDTAFITTSTLPAGVNMITAVYSGDTHYNSAQSLPITINVGNNIGTAVTTTTVTTSKASVPLNTVVTFTATVTSTGGPPATGTINFFSDGISIGIVKLVNGTATLTTSTLPNGLDVITATYSGDVNYASSTSVVVVETVGTVTPTVTFTTLVTSNPAVSIGDTATLTATVTAPSTSIIPTGIVSFLEGDTTMGSAILQPDGTATFDLPALDAGIDQIRATYNGALVIAGTSTPISFSASTSTPITETVGPATPGTTATNLTASTGVSDPGGSVSFTVAVVPAIPGGAIPTGAVTFFDGTTQIGVVPVQTDGTAALTTTSLPGGINNITATYGGDTVYDTSSSAAFTVAVGSVTPTYTIALNTSAGSAMVGAPVVLTATVTPSVGAAAPIGEVTFFSGGVVLGTGIVQSDGTASFTTSGLAAGNSSITAIYSGLTGVSGSSSSILQMVSSLPPSQSLPTVSGESVPTGMVVAGQPTKITLPVTITNQSMAISVGIFTLNVYLNTSATLDGHEVLVATGTKSLDLDPTAASKPWKFLIKSLPASLPSGVYNIIIQSTDPVGATAVTTTTKTIQVVAPVVSLTATATAVTPPTLQVGQNGSIILTLTNDGNVAASGALSIILSLSIDGATPLSIAGTILSTMTGNAKLNPHQTRTFRIHFRPTAVIPAATYYPYVSISLDGYSATTVGKTKFNIA